MKQLVIFTAAALLFGTMVVLTYGIVYEFIYWLLNRRATRMRGKLLDDQGALINLPRKRREPDFVYRKRLMKHIRNLHPHVSEDL